VSPDAAIAAWLAVSIFFQLIAAYEIAAERNIFGWGWHTISWLSSKHHWLGWLITAGMLGEVGWWIYHFLMVSHPR
jgi:hypothetical protein